jgi:hypothetical protein
MRANALVASEQGSVRSNESSQGSVNAFSDPNLEAHTGEEEHHDIHHSKANILSHAKLDACFSVGVVVLYLSVGSMFYGFYSGWTVTETVYFSMATITTVGYGDFNGGDDRNTIVFTLFYAFFGVGMIGLAIADIMHAIEEAKNARKRIVLHKMAEAFSKVHHSNKHKHMVGAGGEPALSWWERVDAWSKAGALRRVFRCFIPVIFSGCVGAVILMFTEEPNSDILTAASPWTTAFYCATVTSLSIGYGTL